MENYELHRAARVFPKFIDDLSNWYIRRSRKRFWKSENDEDKNEAYATLHHVLSSLAKMMAPFAPFIAEEIYRNLTGKESVHLADLPTGDRHHVDEFLNDEMRRVREIVTEGLQFRAQAKVKVRQPLSSVTIKGVFQEELIEIIKEELNVKEVLIDAEQIEKAVLDVNITPELAEEGMAREIIRHIQEMRKEAGYEVDNRIKIWYTEQLEVFKSCHDLIAKETLCDGLLQGSGENADLTKELNIDGKSVGISIKKA
jgi:isoleucyl-tRNA synthetase